MWIKTPSRGSEHPTSFEELNEHFADRETLKATNFKNRSNEKPLDKTYTKFSLTTPLTLISPL